MMIWERWERSRHPAKKKTKASHPFERRPRIVMWGALSLLAVLSGSRLLATPADAPALPELPRLALDKSLPEVRAAVKEAYDAVMAHPRDASANGKLGMVLHAHSFPADAEVCYRRAPLPGPPSLRCVPFLALPGRAPATITQPRRPSSQRPPTHPEALPAAHS